MFTFLQALIKAKKINIFIPLKAKYYILGLNNKDYAPFVIKLI